jgi:hypothetical protein
MYPKRQQALTLAFVAPNVNVIHMPLK